MFVLFKPPDVLVAVAIREGPRARPHTIDERTNIFVAVGVFQSPFSRLHPIGKRANVCVTISKDKSTFPIESIIFEITGINLSGRISLSALTVPFPKLPIPSVCAAV